MEIFLIYATIKVDIKKVFHEKKNSFKSFKNININFPLA